jgi:hypothetical protein
MRATVATAFPLVTAKLEGRTPYMYRDVKGFVTVDTGNKIDPIGDAMLLPWCHGGDPSNPADDAAIVAGWESVKAMPAGLTANRYAIATDLRLTDSALDELQRRVLRGFDASLAARFPSWESLPAGVQLATLSMVWACGAHGVEYEFPRFDSALAAGDFLTCAAECHMDATGNPGLVPRNALNERLFSAAATPQAQQDPATIYGWP